MDVLRFSRGNGGGAEDYEPTDSEEEYSDGEKEVLKEMRERNKRDTNEKQELMAFDESDDDEADGGDDDDDEDEAAMSDSDIEGNDEAGVPDAKDWGSQSRNYYNTDFVDQDYSTYNEQEEEMAKQEEEEAKIIQVRLAKQMKEEDFQLDDIFGSAATAEGEARGVEEDSSLPADLSGLTKRERQRLFEKDSPEFAGLVADFEKYAVEEEQLLNPVLSYVRENKVPRIPALKYAQLYQNIALTYCSNVAFYLSLKAKRVNVRNHPITKRLVQFKKLLGQLSDKYENIVRPQLEALLQRIEDGDQFEVRDIERKSKLSVLSQYEQDEGVGKKGKLGKPRMEDEEDDESDDDDDDDDEEAGGDLGGAEEGDEDIPESERRGITYQIAKNKGLRVHRKKEQRNPRVKHRSKFRKALIRRKGAVRTVRKETQRYGGEISGIKATVSKSVKFKS